MEFLKNIPKHPHHGIYDEMSMNYRASLEQQAPELAVALSSSEIDKTKYLGYKFSCTTTHPSTL